eukprot:SAG22_NODE_2968_length_2039_cov_1.675662_2_plen_425_part_01
MRNRAIDGEGYDPFETFCTDLQTRKEKQNKHDGSLAHIGGCGYWGMGHCEPIDIADADYHGLCRYCNHTFEGLDFEPCPVEDQQGHVVKNHDKDTCGQTKKLPCSGPGKAPDPYNRSELDMQVLFSHATDSFRNIPVVDQQNLQLDMEKMFGKCAKANKKLKSDEDGCWLDLLVGLGHDVQFEAFARAFSQANTQQSDDDGVPSAAVYMSGLSPAEYAVGWCGSVTWHPKMKFPAEQGAKPSKIDTEAHRYMGGSSEFATFIRDMMLKKGPTYYKQRWKTYGVTAAHAEAAAGLVMLQIALERSHGIDSETVAATMRTGLNVDTFFGKISLEQTYGGARTGGWWNTRGGQLTVGVVQNQPDYLRNWEQHWWDADDPRGKHLSPLRLVGPTSMARSVWSDRKCVKHSTNSTKYIPPHTVQAQRRLQ